MKLNHALFSAILAIAMGTSLPVMAGNSGGGRSQDAGPFLLSPTEDLSINIYNSCSNPATYSLTVTNVGDGSVLKQSTGTVASQRGLSTLLGATTTADVTAIAKVSVTCRLKSNSSRKILVNGAIVDRTTHDTHALLPFAEAIR